MAKTKLKSVFTREDVYTILQLLKALADGVDTNEALTDEDIKKLQDKVLISVAVISVDNDHKKIVLTFADNTTIESVPFESGGATLPQGYEVDSTGKVIINKALTAVSEGDVEVVKNLIIDGKAKINNKDDIIDTSGNVMFPDTALVTLLTEDNISNYKEKAGVFYINGTSRKLLIVGYITNVFTDSHKIYAYGIIASNAPGVYKYSGYSTNKESIGIDYITGLIYSSNNNGIINEDELKSSINFYQHTVTMNIAHGYQTPGISYITFTALSNKNTPIDSYQDLHTVFGGRNIATSGSVLRQSGPTDYESATAVLINLHGGSISTDKVTLVYSPGSTSTNPGEVTLSSLGTITFKDDVYPL